MRLFRSIFLLLILSSSLIPKPSAEIRKDFRILPLVKGKHDKFSEFLGKEIHIEVYMPWNIKINRTQFLSKKGVVYDLLFNDKGLQKALKDFRYFATGPSISTAFKTNKVDRHIGEKIVSFAATVKIKKEFFSYKLVFRKKKGRWLLERIDFIEIDGEE